MKYYALVSITRGDELIAPARSIVATSEDRRKLELLRDDRAKERSEFLAENKLPTWAETIIIAREDIEEVTAI